MEMQDPKRSLRSALDEISALRDQAKVQIHLLSLEARTRLSEIEAAFDSVERRIEQGGGKATEAVFSRVQQLTRAARDLLQSEPPSRSGLSSHVRAVMKIAVHTCYPSDHLHQVAKVLWDTDCGSAPVVSEEGKLVGMITDRDICMACYMQGGPLSNLTVESAMSKRLYVCSEEDSIARALEILRLNQVRRLPVADREGRLVGILALADIVRWLHAQSVGRVAANAALVATLAAVSSPPLSDETGRATAAE